MVCESTKNSYLETLGACSLRLHLILLLGANLFLADSVNSQELGNDIQLNISQPYLLSARFHLEQGTNQGYLVVKVDLATGHSIYSVAGNDEAKSATTTKLLVSHSDAYQLLAGFSPDASPKQVDDQWLGTVKKHFQTVQFFAPIDFHTMDTESLQIDIQFEGMVCNETGCIPIRKNIVGTFEGYFQNASQTPQASNVDENAATFAR